MGMHGCCDPLARQAVAQNLRDAGCPETDVARMMQLLDEGRTAELVQSLKCQRCRLIEDLHKQQKKVDCLDYLIYQLKKCACRSRGDQAPADPCPPQDCGGE